MKAHLSIDHEELIANLENGDRLVADTSADMAEQLIIAGVTADELTATAWEVDIEHAPMVGQLVAIKFALRKRGGDKQ